MNKDDRIVLLQDGIDHWHRMRAFTAEDFAAKGQEAPYGSDCPCCKAFDSDECKDSIGDLCPIAVKSGAYGCANTPWRAAADAFDEVEHEVRRGSQAINRAMERWRTAADSMIGFMEECLKEEEAK